MENYLIIIEDAGNNFSAYSPDIEGVIATGKNPQEARENFLEALSFHLEGLKEDGETVPKPRAKFAYTTSDYNGRLSIRVSKTTHSRLAKLAEAEGVSISHLINDAIIEKYSKI